MEIIIKRLTPVPCYFQLSLRSKYFTHQHLLELHIHVTVHRNRFFLITNQTHYYPNLFRHKILHVSGIFSAQHQQFSTVHSALVSFMQVFDDRFQAESGWNCVPS